jgi:TRAP-type transport system small permease protein
MISQALLWVSRALLVVASIIAMVLAFVVLADVIGRAGFNRPLRGTAEIVASSIVVIAYLQVTYAIVTGGMMRVTMFTDMMPMRVRSLVNAFTSALGLLLFWIVFRGSIDGFMTAWTWGSYEGEGALRVPTWPVRLTVLVGAGLAGVAYALLVIDHLRAALTGRTPDSALSLK